MSEKKQDYQEPEYKSPITVKEEEIDLGGMFKLIGKMLMNFFSFIGKLLKGIFHYLIVLLIFIKEYLKPILIATVIGGVLGFVIDYIRQDVYTYDMIIEPSYGSIDQVFEKMEYYNVLISNKDSIALSEKFNISFSDANSLVAFQLTPYETEKDQIIAYNEFLKKTDTIIHDYFGFKDFVGDGTSKFDSRRYVYRIKSRDPHLKLFRDEILADIEENPSIKREKEIQLNTLRLDSLAVRISLEEVDSLRSLYKRITLIEANKEISSPSSSTYLDFSEKSKSNNNDIELFKIAEGLNNKLIEIEVEKSKSIDIVNVITTFNPAGRLAEELEDSMMFLLARLFGGFVLAFILLKKLNDYLIKYKEQFIH